jgi:hypothetical protein
MAKCTENKFSRKCKEFPSKFELIKCKSLLSESDKKDVKGHTTMEGIYEKSGKQRKAPTQQSRRGKRVEIAQGTTSWGKDISSQVGTPTKP